jgi:hypothetical protein
MGNLHSSLICCCPKPKHFIIKEDDYKKKDSYEEIIIRNKEITFTSGIYFVPTVIIKIESFRSLKRVYDSKTKKK